MSRYSLQPLLSQVAYVLRITSENKKVSNTNKASQSATRSMDQVGIQSSKGGAYARCDLNGRANKSNLYFGPEKYEHRFGYTDMAPGEAVN